MRATLQPEEIRLEKSGNQEVEAKVTILNRGN